MNPERWPQIKALLGEVLEHPTEERAQFLTNYATADAELKAEVARLLEFGPDQKKFLEPPSTNSIEPPLRRISLAFSGCTIDDYEMLEEIGHGASGTVYRARQISLDRPVAVKILAHHLCASESARKRFKREAEAASKLRHPAIVSIIAFGHREGVCYIAMELVSGKSLRELIAARLSARSGAARAAEPALLDISDPRVSAELILELARGLQHCHELGVLHRDVKPENIVVDVKQRPRLIDFGLAKEAAVNGLTKTGMISGTPHYMSPEQARVIGAPVDSRTDVYSLGVVLYELLGMRRPFEFTSPGDLLHAIGHSEPRNVKLVDSSIPAGLAAVCMMAIAKRPEHRYATAAAMADDLQLFLDGKQTDAHKYARARRLRAFGTHHRELIGAGALILCLGIFLSMDGVGYNDRSVEAAETGLAMTVPTSVDPDRFANVDPNDPNLTPEQVQQARREVRAKRTRKMREAFEETIRDRDPEQQHLLRQNFYKSILENISLDD